jgi:cytochrome c2
MKAVIALSLATLALCVTYCTPNKAVIGLDALPEQVFTINNEADTTILTRDSILFSFAKGSFATSEKQVTVTVKEALHLSDMLKAGLSTQGPGGVLQSGGMFYLAAKAGGGAVELQKRAGVKVPTYKYRAGMNLYKGQQKDGKVEWAEPEPLLNKEEVEVAISGEQLFKSHCANCHKIDKDYTGPALAYITERRCAVWLRDFTYNSSAMNDPVSQCVKKRWKNVVMTAYGDQLMGPRFDSLYGYIAAESKKYPREPYFKNDECAKVVRMDTVSQYNINRYETKRSKGFGPSADAMDTLPPTGDTSTMPQPVEDPGPPEFPRNNEYYDFTIQVTGWFNIDMLLKDEANVVIGSFRLQIQGSFATRIRAYLVVPGRKVLLEGRTTDNQSFYFDKPEYGYGGLPMPQGEPWVVYLMGEEGSQALWASARGVFGPSHTITLQPQPVADISKELDKLQIDKLEYSITLRYTETRYNIIEQVYEAQHCEGEGGWYDAYPEPRLPAPAMPPIHSTN